MHVCMVTWDAPVNSLPLCYAWRWCCFENLWYFWTQQDICFAIQYKTALKVQLIQNRIRLRQVILTSICECQLSAHDLCISSTPEIIGHSAPDSTDADLHSSLHVISSTHKPLSTCWQFRFTQQGRRSGVHCTSMWWILYCTTEIYLNYTHITLY